MSFIIALCFIIAVVAAGVTYLLCWRLLLQGRAWIALTSGGTAFAGLLAWFLHTVCVPIAPEEVQTFNPPIASRTQAGMTGQRVFQQRDGVWHHCKPWIARKMFF